VPAVADPVLTDIYRAQVRVPGKTGLPHDVFVNTFAFRNVQTGVPLANIASVLTAFYGFFDEFLAGTQAAWTETELRIYDLGQTPPRIPHIVDMPLTVTGGATPYPAEVACCLSYYAERNLPRNRGRIYIGPLSTAASTVTASRIGPTGAFMDALLAAGANVIGSTEDVRWGVVSQRDGDFKQITNLWVDNAYDTQRRRGVEPTSRVVWPTPA
jgi:hypothetical protein